MPGHRYKPSEYALPQIVQTFGNLLYTLEEYHSTHTYQVVSRFCELEAIDYMLLRYLNTGVKPVEEFSDNWLFDGEM